MSWFVANATTIYVLLAILAASLVAVWRHNQRAAFLLYAGGVLILLALFWLAVHYLPSDHRQLEDNVHAMADAVRDGKVEDLMEHISKDFRYKGMTREKLNALAQDAIRNHRVSHIRISDFKVTDWAGDNVAKTWFRVSVWGEAQDHPYPFVTQADFRKEGEHWKLLTMRFYNPVVDQDREIDLPGIP